MKTRILPLLALAAALVGCTQENDASIQFFAVCYPPAPDSTSGACVYPAACENVALGTFWADVAVVDPISGALAPIEIRNQLPDSSDPSAGRLNTNIAYIQTFRMEFELPGGATLPEEWVDVNVTVPTSGGTVALVPLVPPNTANYLSTLAATSGHLVVSVRAAGRYADERDFETGPFKVPVDWCNGCYPSPSYPLPICPIASTGVTACPQFGQYAAYTCMQ